LYSNTLNLRFTLVL